MLRFILTMRNVNMIDDVKLEKQLIGFILTMRNVNVNKWVVMFIKH